MLTFLAVGTAWFFIIFGILVLIELIVVFNDRQGPTWFFGLLLLVFLVLSSAWEIQWILDNPLTVLMYVGIYIGIGLLWSFKEWSDYIGDQVERVNTYSHISLEDIKDNLELNNNWARITNWIVFFPFHFITWLVDDPVKWIAKQFSFIYQGITNRAMKKAVKSGIK